METSSPWNVRRWLREPGFRLSFVPVAILHAGLSMWSLVEPSRVGLGDRAAQRWERARALADSNDVNAFLIEYGWPADYAVHAALGALGGLPLVLFVQLAFWLAALVLLYGAMRSYISIPQWAAGTALAAYALLASNLHQPHTIVTEAFVIPAVAVMVVLIADVARRKALSPTRALALGSAAAIAVAFRAVFLPVLPVASLYLFKVRASRALPLVLANVIALAPLFAWGAIQQMHGHAVQLGGAGFSLEENLAGRMRRMHAMGGGPIPAASDQEAGVGTYLTYTVHNPRPFLRTMSRDLLMLVVNPGVNHTYGTFFGWFDRSEGDVYWMHRLDEVDLGTAALEIAGRGPAHLVWNLFGLVTWGAFCVVALTGMAGLFRGPERPVVVALCVMVATLAFAGFAATSVRFTLRAPMEFVLALFFAAGLPAWCEWQRRWRQSHRMDRVKRKTPGSIRTDR